jgi:hypothetical protein
LEIFLGNFQLTFLITFQLIFLPYLMTSMITYLLPLMDLPPPFDLLSPCIDLEVPSLP